MTIKDNLKDIWVIGDVHGCYKSLMALVDQLPSGAKLCFVGDLIDRGPNSKEVIEFVKSNNHYCVLGNHEQMMADDLFNPSCPNISLSDWYSYNGGKETLDSYFSPRDDEILHEHYNWLKQLPLYLEFPKLIKFTDKQRHLVVSHSSIAKVWSKRDETDISNHTLWNRDVAHGTLPSANEIYNIFGHTPYKTEHIKPFFATTDTGCVYNKNGYDKLTAINFPSLKVVTQDYID